MTLVSPLTTMHSAGGALSPLNGLLSLDYIIQLRIRGVVTSPGLSAYELYIVINCNICELDPV